MSIDFGMAYAAHDAAYQRRMDAYDMREAFESRIIETLQDMSIETAERELPDAFATELENLIGRVLEAVMAEMEKPEHKRDVRLQRLIRAA